MHALNGNGPGARRPPAAPGEPGDGGWQSAPPRRLDPRLLQEPQQIATLRAAGWTIPATEDAASWIRVYDTRLDPAWLQQCARELTSPKLPRMEFIGGDFLTQPQPRRTEAVALDPVRYRRWGPEGNDPYHLLVPPRPHQAAWLERSRQQLALEVAGMIISVMCIVERDRCPEVWDVDALRRALPGTAALVDDPALEVHVTAIGERPRLRRIPAACRQLPPPSWEPAFLALDRVLVVVSVALQSGPPAPMLGRWLGPPPPKPEPSGLELLRVEYLLPPATQQRHAERLLRTAVKTVAKEMALPAPAGPQLRQLQETHGGIVGLLEVPRAEARAWLRGSGCGGLFLRPFWTKDTGSEVARDNFALWWVRGQAAAADRLWQALRDTPGFVGLLAGGRDVAVRAAKEATLTQLQMQVRLTLQKPAFTFVQSNPGASWWRLGPLSSAEAAVVHQLITGLGLKLERDDVRFTVANHVRSRSFTFFMASGTLVKTSLDTGSWSSSEATLTPAQPPPRRSAPSAHAPARATTGTPAGGYALAPQSRWGGPRNSQPQPASQPAPAGPAAGPSPSRRPQSPGAPAVLPQPAAAPSPGPRGPRRDTVEPAASPQPAAPRPRRRNRGGASQSASQPPAAFSASPEYAELLALIRELRGDLLALRQENDLLRRQLAQRGSVHTPYATASADALPAGAPAVDPDPLLTPRAAAPAAGIDTLMDTDSPANSPDPKRPRSGVVPEHGL